MAPLLIFVAVVLTTSGPTSSESLRQHRYVFSGITDKTFSESLLFTSPAKTTTQCAMLCQGTADDNCLSFTHDKQEEVCRGHSRAMAEDTDYVSDEGVRLFARSALSAHTESAWLQTPCETNDDCPVTNAECWSQTCVCAPGFYFSQSNGTCSEDCSALSDTYSMYQDKDLGGVYADRMADMEDCVKACNADPLCLSIVYDPDFLLMLVEQCFLKHSTPRTNPSDWVSKPTFRTYIRGCL